MQSQSTAKVNQMKPVKQNYPKFQFEDTQGRIIERFMISSKRFFQISKSMRYFFILDIIVRLSIIILSIIDMDNLILQNLLIATLVQTFLNIIHTRLFYPKLNENKQFKSKIFQFILQNDFSAFFKQCCQYYQGLKIKSIQNIDQEDVQIMINSTTSWFFLRRIFTALRIFITIEYSVNKQLPLNNLLLFILAIDFISIIIVNNYYYQTFIFDKCQDIYDQILTIFELLFQFCQSIIFIIYLQKLKGLIYVVVLLYFINIMIIKVQIQQRGFFDPHTISLTEQIFLGSKICFVLSLFRNDRNQVEMVSFNKFNKLNLILFLTFQYSKQGLLLYTGIHNQVKYLANIQIWILIINSFFMIFKGCMIQIDNPQQSQYQIQTLEDALYFSNIKQSNISILWFNISNIKIEKNLINTILINLNKQNGYSKIYFDQYFQVVNQYGNIQIDIQEFKDLSSIKLVYETIVQDAKSISFDLNKIIIDKNREYLQKKVYFMILRNQINKEEQIHAIKKNEIITYLEQFKGYESIRKIISENSSQRMVNYIIAYNKLYSNYLINNPTSILYDLIEN